MSACCGLDRRNAAIIVLSMLLVVAAVGWWHEARKVPPPTPPVETVEVLVAAKDLALGTAFTKDTVDHLTAFRQIPKAELPGDKKVIHHRDELMGKRLSRATYAGEFIYAAVVKTPAWSPGESGSDIMSIPMASKIVVAEKVRPGSRIDLIASYVEGTERHVFTLLPDMHVLAVNGVVDPLSDPVATQDPTMVSFTVDQKQALLITLANQTDCELEVSRPLEARNREFEKTLVRLKELKKRQDAKPVPVAAPAPRQSVNP